MPYPATIIGGSYGMHLGAAGAGDFEFEYSGNRYCCLADNANVPGTAGLHFFKSTDAGLTWSELDSSNAPNVYPGGPTHPCYTLGVDGSTVQLLWLRVNSTPVAIGLTRCTFDLTAGAWGTPTNISASGLQLSVTSQAKALMHLIVRGAGDYLVLYSGVKSGTSGRVSYSTYDGSTLGAAVSIPSQSAGITYLPQGGTYDPTADVTLFAYREGADISSNGKVWVVGLDSSNTFGTPVQVIASTNLSWYTNSPPVRFMNGGTAYFGFAATLNTGGNYIIKWYAAPCALNPTFGTPETLFTGNAASNDDVPNTIANMPATGDGLTVAAGVSATDILVAWTAWLYDEPTQPYVYNYSTSVIGSATWSGVAVLFVPAIADDDHKTSQVYARAGTLGIGVTGVSYANFSIQNFKQEAQFYLFGAAPLALLRNTFE
jgi:hypothetical protein